MVRKRRRREEEEEEEGGSERAGPSPLLGTLRWARFWRARSLSLLRDLPIESELDPPLEACNEAIIWLWARFLGFRWFRAFGSLRG